MSEPQFELPKNLTPHGDYNDREIEEIVSPVQPVKGPNHVKSGLVPFLVVLICALVGGAALYDRWPKFEYRIKEAKAPESETQVIPTPSVVVALAVSPTPTPQISSIATDEPSVAVAPTPTPTHVPTPTPVAVKPTPKPTVAGASTTKNTTPQATAYTSPYGYVVQLRNGASISAEGAIAAVYDKQGAVVLRIEVAELLLETTGSLGHQLALSSDITDLKAVILNGYAGYSYRIAGKNALALIKGSTVYYLVEYASGQLGTFTIK